MKYLSGGNCVDEMGRGKESNCLPSIVSNASNLHCEVDVRMN